MYCNLDEFTKSLIPLLVIYLYYLKLRWGICKWTNEANMIHTRVNVKKTMRFIYHVTWLIIDRLPTSKVSGPRNIRRHLSSNSNEYHNQKWHQLIYSWQHLSHWKIVLQRPSRYLNTWNVHMHCFLGGHFMWWMYPSTPLFLFKYDFM